VRYKKGDIVRLVDGWSESSSVMLLPIDTEDKAAEAPTGSMALVLDPRSDKGRETYGVAGDRLEWVEILYVEILYEGKAWYVYDEDVAPVEK
jgi:hypothetical protein